LARISASPTSGEIRIRPAAVAAATTSGSAAPAPRQRRRHPAHRVRGRRHDGRRLPHRAPPQGLARILHHELRRTFAMRFHAGACRKNAANRGSHAAAGIMPGGDAGRRR
jgi:hypothetical protein